MRIDDVAAIGGQSDAAAHLDRRRARLGELPRHPPEPDHREARRRGDARRHRLDQGEIALDILRREFGEALGAIAALEQEGAPRLRLGDRRLERLDLLAGVTSGG